MHLLVGALVGAALGVVGTIVAAKLADRPITWRSCLAGAVGGAVGGIVTAASLGTAAPGAIALGRAVLAFGAGGSASGLVQALAQNLLGHRSLARGLLSNTLGGLVGGVVAGLTLGIAAPMAGDLGPPLVSQAWLGSFAGLPAGAAGGATQAVVENAQSGRPLGNGVRDAALDGALTAGIAGGGGGAILGGVAMARSVPAADATPVETPGADAPTPERPPENGIAQALDPTQERGAPDESIAVTPRNGARAPAQRPAPGSLEIDPESPRQLDRRYTTSTVLGEGSYKVTYALRGSRYVLSTLEGPYGRDLSVTQGAAMLNGEVSMLRTLADHGVPTMKVVDMGVFDGHPALVAERYVSGSRAPDFRTTGYRYLNETSLADLDLIKNTLVSQGLAVRDLQFLISRDGHLAVVDPLRVYEGSSEDDVNFYLIRDGADWYVVRRFAERAIAERAATPRRR
jgi:hypothetical protein